MRMYTLVLHTLFLLMYVLNLSIDNACALESKSETLYNQKLRELINSTVGKNTDQKSDKALLTEHMENIPNKEENSKRSQLNALVQKKLNQEVDPSDVGVKAPSIIIPQIGSADSNIIKKEIEEALPEVLKAPEIVKVPEINVPEIVKAPEIVKVPEMKVPEMKVPEMKVPEVVKVPEIKVPEIKVPEIKVPEVVKVPEIKVPEIKVPEIKVPEVVKAPEVVKVPEIKVQEVVKVPEIKVPEVVKVPEFVKAPEMKIESKMQLPIQPALQSQIKTILERKLNENNTVETTNINTIDHLKPKYMKPKRSAPSESEKKFANIVPFRDGEYDRLMFEYNKHSSGTQNYKIVTSVPDYIKNSSACKNNRHLNKVYVHNDYVKSIFFAVDQQNLNLLERLFIELKNENIENINGETPLFYAIKKRKNKVLRYLIARDINLRFENEYKQNAMNIALKYNNYYAISLLKHSC